MSNTLAFIEHARAELRGNDNIDTFMRLRYNEMWTKCPHGVFSVEQASTDFFEVAYEHIMGTVGLPTGTKDRPLSEYDHNYIKWIKEAQAQLKA